jgi:hypothetical protein
MGIKIGKWVRNCAISFGMVFGAATMAPGDVPMIGAASAGSCVLVSEYVDENGQRWGVYHCPERVVRACTRGCPHTIWDFRDEQ